MSGTTTKALNELEAALPEMSPDLVVATARGLIGTVRNQRRELARLQRQYDEAMVLVEGYRRRDPGERSAVLPPMMREIAWQLGRVPRGEKLLLPTPLFRRLHHEGLPTGENGIPEITTLVLDELAEDTVIVVADTGAATVVHLRGRGQ